MLRTCTLLLLALAVLRASSHGLHANDMDLEEVERELDGTLLQKIFSGSGTGARGAAVSASAATRHCGRKMVTFVRSICGADCQHPSPADLANECCQHSCSAEFIRNECCPSF